MRGPQPAYPIQLTAEEAKRLQHLIRAHTTPQTLAVRAHTTPQTLAVRAHTTPQTLAVRARIILRANAHPEQSNQQIASVVGTTDRSVRTWRGRWVKTRCLADAPRSGAPRRFSPSGACAGHRHRL